MLEIKLLQNKNGEYIWVEKVDVDYFSTTKTLKRYIKNAQKYIRAGYICARVILHYLIYIGDDVEEKEMILFNYENQENFYYKNLTSSDILTIASELSDLDYIEVDEDSGEYYEVINSSAAEMLKRIGFNVINISAILVEKLKMSDLEIVK